MKSRPLAARTENALQGRAGRAVRPTDGKCSKKIMRACFCGHTRVRARGGGHCGVYAHAAFFFPAGKGWECMGKDWIAQMKQQYSDKKLPKHAEKKAKNCEKKTKCTKKASRKSREKCKMGDKFG